MTTIDITDASVFPIQEEGKEIQDLLLESNWDSVKITQKDEIRYSVSKTDSVSHDARRNDRIILGNQLNDTDVILPAEVDGKIYTIKNISATSTTTVKSSKNIDGAATFVLTNQFDAVTVVLKDNEWHIISEYLA